MKRNIGLKRHTVKLSSHSDEWRQDADNLKQKLIPLLADVVLDIQHVGSTSVHGLKAKPIIDMIIWVQKLGDIYDYISRLEEVGVYHREDNDNESQVFFACGDLDNDIITHHIHVILYNSKVRDDYIKFRDILNNNNEKKEEYEQLKQNLAKKFFNDRKSYTSSKKDFIQNVLNN